ncbi:zinc finger protein 19-like isoform X2 [Armigeres subalbatus]|uniref:zinc finger protein 19-like isoform X2 n=1 Tax=Armigeres subalbatus TaxID=124917 RepID=UPI002ED29922
MVIMDPAQSLHLDSDFYEPVFICNICKSILTDPVCRNDHITAIKPGSSEIDFENLIKLTVVNSNNDVQPPPNDVSSEYELKNKLCAIIPRTDDSPIRSKQLCPVCGEISDDKNCRKNHDFKLEKDICTNCGVEYDSIEMLIQHGISCIPVDEYFAKTTESKLVESENAAEVGHGTLEPVATSLPHNIALITENGTGQYQVMALLSDDSVMKVEDSIFCRNFSLPQTNDVDTVLEWDESMSLAVLDVEDPSSELLPIDEKYDKLCKPELAEVEMLKNEPTILTIPENKLSNHAPGENRKLLLCDKCEMEFPDVDTFTTHYLGHGSDASFMCQFCWRNYTRLYWFRVHMKTHAHQMPIVCMFCDDYFMTTTLHETHLRTVHQLSKAEMDQLVEAMNKDQKNPFMCMECGKWLKSEKHLAMHRNMHEMVEGRIIPMESKDGKLNAATANRPVSDNPTLLNKRASGKSKMKPIHIFECNICSKNIRSIEEVRLHLLSHSENRLFKCEVCDERFRAMAQLQQHQCGGGRSMAFPADYHKCCECGKIFSHAAGLACHTRTHECYMEDYACDKCPLKFKVLSAYLIHRAKFH